MLRQKENDFWVSNLSPLWKEGHLSLESLENLGCHFAFVALGAHDVTVDFAFFDEFDSFPEISVEVAGRFDFVDSYSEHCNHASSRVFQVSDLTYTD